MDFRGEMKWQNKAKMAVTCSHVKQMAWFISAHLTVVFYALYVHAGWVIWRFRMGKGSIASPYTADGLVTIGSAGHFLYTLLHKGVCSRRIL